MTYRERREARAERLRDWAESRDRKAATAFDAAHQLADSIPFGQPILVGHHSERHARRDADRIHNGMRAGIEHSRKADSMRERADNIERAAAAAIYSDDPDAAEALTAKIAALEAERTAWRAYNAAVRKAGKVTPEASAILSPKQRADLETVARYAAWQLGKHGEAPAYVSANLSGNISRLRARLAGMDR